MPRLRSAQGTASAFEPPAIATVSRRLPRAAKSLNEKPKGALSAVGNEDVSRRQADAPAAISRTTPVSGEGVANTIALHHTLHRTCDRMCCRIRCSCS